MIKLFITDDHQIIIDGIKSLLSTEKDIQIVGEALSGKNTIEQLINRKVDVLLLDISMPEIDGIETCNQIRTLYPAVKVLILTMHNEKGLISSALKNGAKGYILKTSGRDVLVKAITTIANGETYFSEDVKNTFIESNVSGNKQNTRILPLKLTRREKEVLELIAEEFTTNEIGQKLFISKDTVETHRKNLLSKFGARNMAGLIRIAIEKDLLD
jgi:DNA-binding NarL/FixJ family response regulator